MDSSALISSLEAAVEAAPADLNLRAHLAQLLIEAGRPTDAAAHIRVALELDASHPATQQVVLQLLESTGDKHASSYRERIESQPMEGVLDEAGDLQDSVHSNREVVTPDGQTSEVIPDTAEELLESWEGSDAMEEAEFGELSASNVTLQDVGGMERVKAQLNRSFLAPMHNPELAAAFGKNASGGLLLWGPPGCGKTFLARATAGEMGANFYNVGLSDVLDMWIGSSEKNLAAIFETARRNTPCVLFFDEVDALGQKRSHFRAAGATMRGIVNQLLAELDGVGAQNEGVFVLAATNHPWDVDEALLRPGRFDRKLLVLPPDAPARQSILQFHLRGRPAENVDLASIVEATDGFSGADLALVIEEATESALDESIGSGSVVPISQGAVERALASVKPSIGPWLEAARNHVIYANRSGDYDELEDFLKTQDLKRR